MALTLVVDAWWQKTDRGLRRRNRGDVLEVDASTEKWLVSAGIAADVTEAPQGEEPEPDDEDVDSAEAPQGEEPEPEESADNGRPLKTGTIEEWRAYAKSLGIDPAGLKKPEIIAAVNAQ